MGDGSGPLQVEFKNCSLHNNSIIINLRLKLRFYSFCSVPVNETAMLIIGGYSQEGPLSSVELLDIKSGRRMRFLSGNVLLLTQFFSLTYLGRWEKLPDLPQPRYGHACLLMELAGQEGVLVIIIYIIYYL